MSFEDDLRDKIDNTISRNEETIKEREEFYRQWLTMRQFIDDKFKPVCPILRERKIKASCTLDTSNFKGSAVLSVQVDKSDKARKHVLRLTPNNKSLEIDCSVMISREAVVAEWIHSYPLEGLTSTALETIVKEFTVKIVDNFYAD